MNSANIDPKCKKLAVVDWKYFKFKKGSLLFAHPVVK